MSKYSENKRKGVEHPLIFHWVKVKDRYVPYLNRGKTLGTEEVMEEFIKSERLEKVLSPRQLAVYFNGVLESMVRHTLTDGRCRSIDGYFSLRLDMTGSAERQDEQYDPRKHKFTLNFQKARRFSEKSKRHNLKILGTPICEVPITHSVMKSVHSQGSDCGIVYPGWEIIIEGKGLRLGQCDQVALKVDYPVESMMYSCPIVSQAPDRIVVESPKRFQMKYMRESVIGLTGEIVLYLHDSRRPHRQPAHGSRFKVKFVRPPEGK